MILALLLGCVGSAASPPEPVTPVPVSAPAVTPAAPAAPATPIFTPRTVYAACRERVELPEAPAECASDADCAAAGCSKEVCTTRTAGAGLTTTCEVQDCFAVLDTCRCTAGVCAWDLKLPEGLLRPIPGLTPSP